MNVVFRFLEEHARRSGVELTSELSYIMTTARFDSSRNVVFLVCQHDSAEPVLVAKVARVDDAGGFLAREASNLQIVHTLRPGGFESIPRLIAHEVFAGEILLVETALQGRLMRPSFVRRHPIICLDTVFAWLLEFHRATATGHTDGTAMHAPPDEPLTYLQGLIPDVEVGRLIANTRSLTSDLMGISVPFVFEHGDLSSPNILVTQDGRLGVLDWELSEPRGLPCLDLFFFLSFVAFARRSARTLEEALAAFHEAFFGPAAWTRHYVLQYAQQLGVSRSSLRSLFVLCWGRYVASLAARSQSAGQDMRGAAGAVWLQRNWYWHLWRHAVRHAGELEYA